jgi:hypothetical protein
MSTPTKKEILSALELAIADHKATAGTFCVDWEFITALRGAITIVQASKTTKVPEALVA